MRVERNDRMKNSTDIDAHEIMANMEMLEVSMPGHKEQLKKMLLAQGSLDSQRSGNFLSSALNKTIGVILLKKRALAIAVPIMVLLVAVMAYQSLVFRPQAVAAVTLQVNPALTLTLDQKNIVLETVGENAEGLALVAEYPFKGKGLKEALEELTERLHDKGFLQPGSEVIITVHPLDGLEQASLVSLSSHAQQIMSENLNRYNVQRPDSFVISQGLHRYLGQLGLTPRDYVELLKANLTEEEIVEVVGALGRKDTVTASLPYIEFDLEIKSVEGELSAEFQQKRYGVYAKVEIEDDSREDTKLEGGRALEYLLPILEKLEISAAMPKREIVERVLAAFAWQGSLEEFELEVKFADGSKLDFEWEDAESHKDDNLTLAFWEFDLEIESDDRELSVEFEVKNGSFNAQIEIEENGRKIELEGAAALEYLLPILEKLEINASMSKREIVDRLLAAFAWQGSLEEFELEVKFADGSKLDFEWEDAESHKEDNLALAFWEFDLEIESDDRELSVEFEVKNGSFNAQIEIEENGREIELEGVAALDYLLPTLKKLDINAGMSRQQIVDRVLAAFAWSYHYDEFGIEVKFIDGTSIHFETDG